MPWYPSIRRVGPGPATSPDLWAQALQQLPDEDRALLLAQGGEKLKVLKSLSKLVDDRRKAQDAKNIHVEVGGHDYNVKDTAEKALRWIDQFKTVVDGVAGVDPLHAGLPWAGFKVLMKFTLDHADANAALLVGVEKMSQLIERCHLFERLYLWEKLSRDVAFLKATTLLQESLQGLYTCILTFLAQCIKHYDSKRRSVARVIDFLKPSNISTLLDSCNQYADRAERAVQDCERTQSQEGRKFTQDKLKNISHLLVDLVKPLERVDKRVQQMMDWAEEERDVKILRWVSSLPHGHHHATASEGRTAGTCLWLMKHRKYIEWLESRKSSSLWLHGHPGMGKTKLMSAAVDDLRTGETKDSTAFALAYFYCSRSQDQRRQAKGILASLIRQFAITKSRRALPRSIYDLYQNDRNSPFGSNSDDLRQHSELLTQLLSLNSMSYIFIDALDECSEDERRRLLETLDVCIQKAGRCVKLLISSQPQRDIRSFLRDATILPLDPEANRSDIDLHVRTRLGSCPFAWTEFLDDKLYSEVLNTLVHAGNGMFLWVTLQLNYLFKLGIRSDVEKRLHELARLPKEMTAAYREIYKRIEKQEGSYREIANRALQWMIVSKDPLSEEMLLAAVCQDLTTTEVKEVYVRKDVVKQVCQNLVRLDDMGDGCAFQFYHNSVREYLEGQRHFVRDAHTFVAKVCLSKLMNESLYTADSPPLVEFSCYAIFHWFRDVRNDGLADKTVIEQLEQFLGEPGAASISYQRWVRCLMNSKAKVNIGRKSELYFEIGDLLPETSPAFGAAVFGFGPALASWWNRHPFDVEQRNRLGKTLLWLAASYNCAFEVDVLLRKGAKVDATKQSERTPLHMACSFGDAELVAIFLRYQADVSLAAPFWGTALHAACSNPRQDQDILNMLVESKADVNANHQIQGTALQVASAYGFAWAVLYLLKHRADVNLQGGQYGTALQAAEHTRNVECAKILLEAGANPKLRPAMISTYNNKTTDQGYQQVSDVLEAYG